MISIVIPVHNQLDHTRLCLDSITAYTPQSHEVIVIDNGSTDNTPDYLRSRPDIRLITNTTNQGFAAATNQGIQAAGGDYVLLLNNDTVVTPGWLDRMLAVFDKYPDVGLVGPVSNYASGVQYANGEMMSLSDRAKQYSGQSKECSRLIGFCLLARRVVFDRIGLLDEQFGLGNFDDDDFCLRARLGGFKARVALDSFVYHAGHATFRSNGFDYGAILDHNWRLFKEKWRLPADLTYGDSYLPHINWPVTVGIAMLARNCETEIPKALEPFIGKVDKIAVLLGGISSDSTLEVARQWADVVGEYDGPLNEQGGLLNFGLARQQSFDLLDTDWVLLVEPDDRWAGIENLREVINEAEGEGRQSVLFPHSLDHSRFLQARLFRRNSGKWVYPIHESFQYHDPANTHTLITNSMSLRQEKSAEHRNASLERNIRMAERYLQGHDDFRALLHLSKEYCVAGRFEDGLKAANQAAANLPADVTPDNQFQIHFVRAMALLHLHQYEPALGAATSALRYINDGAGWTLLAQIALFLEVYELVIYAADNALRLGHQIDTMLQPEGNITVAPCHLKAKALVAIGREQEAIAALDLGIRLGGGPDMVKFKFELCQKLGVIP
jgi:GT2 family glycosyltransferase